MEVENQYNELIENGKYLRSSRTFASSNRMIVKHTSNHKVRQKNFTINSNRSSSQTNDSQFETSKATKQYSFDSAIENKTNEKHALLNGTLISDKIVPSSLGEETKQEQEDKDHYQSSARGSAFRKSAYEIYKAAGDWWNVFPKTDYTYAKSSTCRKEIAPGVLPMPNMSRRALRSSGDATFATCRSSHSGYVSDEFEEDSYTLSSSRISVTRQSLITRIVLSCWTLITTVFSVLTLRSHRLGLNTTPIRSRGVIHRPWYNKLEVIYYKTTCWFLLFDVWCLSLFRKSRDNNSKETNTSKHSKYLLFLLIPPLILAGLSFWNSEKSALSPFFSEDSWSFFRIVSTEPQQYERQIQNKGENIDVIVQKILSSSEFKNIIDLQEERRREEKLKREEAILAAIQQEQVRLKSELEHKGELLLKQQEIYNQLMLENSHMRMQLEELGVSMKDKVDPVVATDHQIWVPHLKRLESQLRILQADRIHLSRKIGECCKATPPEFPRVAIEDHVTSFLSGLFGLDDKGEPQTIENVKLWIRKLFEAKENLEERLVNITNHMNIKIEEVSERSAATIMASVSEQMKQEFLRQEALQSDEKSFTTTHVDHSVTSCGNCTLSVEQVKEIVNKALNLYDADKTGMVDYALESGGGNVINTRCTENYDAKSPAMSFLGFFFPWSQNHPRIAIQPEVQPGKCWAFRGAWGYLVIKLTTRIKVSAFSMDHIPRSLSPTGNIDSAPKNFSVWGMENETDRDPVLLGKYMFDEFGPSLQMFPVQNKEASPYQIVELHIESNHGNLEYTCLYRFRVHGVPTGKG